LSCKDELCNVCDNVESFEGWSNVGEDKVALKGVLSFETLVYILPSSLKMNISKIILQQTNTFL